MNVVAEVPIMRRGWRGAAGLALLVLLAALVGVHPAAPGPLPYSVPVGHGPAALALDARTGRAFVTNRFDDSVSVLETRSGRVLRTVAVGLVPTGAAVDVRSGHALVLDVGEDSVHVLETATGRLLRTT